MTDRYLRAQALEAVGRVDEAVAWYSSFEAFSTYDLLFAAPARLALARIAERDGRIEDARAHYERFLLLWEDPDPGFGRTSRRRRARWNSCGELSERGD